MEIDADSKPIPKAYALSQLTFTVLSAWSHFKASHNHDYWAAHRWLDRLRRKWVGVTVAIIFLTPAWLAAIFTTFAGTLMQITGIYQNCVCAASGYWAFSPNSTVQLAADTEADRHASENWQTAGYTALIFLVVVTYFAWWCQRHLREKFSERVEHLIAEDLTPSCPRTPGTVKSSEISTLCNTSVSSSKCRIIYCGGNRKGLTKSNSRTSNDRLKADISSTMSVPSSVVCNARKYLNSAMDGAQEKG